MGTIDANEIAAGHGMMMSDSATITLKDGHFQYIIPIIDQALFDTLIKKKEMCIFCREGEFIVGIKSDFSLVAVRDAAFSSISGQDEER